jgi:hypothetical protein
MALVVTCDRAVVVAEDGTHDDLLRLGGIYAVCTAFTTSSERDRSYRVRCTFIAVTPKIS